MRLGNVVRRETDGAVEGRRHRIVPDDAPCLPLNGATAGFHQVGHLAAGLHVVTDHYHRLDAGGCSTRQHLAAIRVEALVGKMSV